MPTDAKKIGNILMSMIFVITWWCLCSAGEAVALLTCSVDLAAVFRLPGGLLS